jgi:hypothetical protein
MTATALYGNTHSENNLIIRITSCMNAGISNGPARGDEVFVNNDVLVQIDSFGSLYLIGNTVAPV